MVYPYVCVFNAVDVNSSDPASYSGNGLRVLYPIKCTITEVLNGEYSLSLTHPVDEYGTWKYITENNIIKAQGQLFRIYKKSRIMGADGKMQITAEALHIFYDLNFYFIKDTRPVLQLPDAALEWIVTPAHDGDDCIANGDPKQRFEFSTDLDNNRFDPDNYHTAHYEKMSVTRALIGDENCFVKTWGGEILRDNFKVGIKKNIGNRDAFNIRYGVDMVEIQEDIDLTNYATALYYEATVFNETQNGSSRERTETVIFDTIENGEASVDLPVRPMAFYEFEVDLKSINKLPSESYPSLYEIQEECEKRAMRYLLTERQPQISFSVKFADLKKYDIYKDFVGLQKCNLGDIGNVYHEILDINVTQQIVKKTVDAITGETLSIELGNLKKTLTGQLARIGTPR